MAAAVVARGVLEEEASAEREACCEAAGLGEPGTLAERWPEAVPEKERVPLPLPEAEGLPVALPGVLGVPEEL